jgi:Prp18 domain-containing protein/pre-mRNA processing factor 4 (PRP4)-like protein
MDFASLMKSQITASKTIAKSDNADTKYIKGSEREAQRQQAYQAEQEALEAARREKQNKRRRLEEEEAEKKREREEKRRRLAEDSRRKQQEEEEQAERARRKRLGFPELPVTKSPEPNIDEDTGDVDPKTVVKELRELGEPVKLFGETQKQQLQRWRRLTGKDAAPIVTNGPIPTTLELVPEEKMKVPEKAPKDVEGKKFLFRQLASYFTMVLEEWQYAMASRTDEVKNSYQGKAAHNAMVQARENLRPFFKKIEKAEIDDAVLDAVVEIVHAAQERRYVDANDGYLRLSIGKA